MSLNPFDNIFSLSGKTALVAGASRGIGLAIAQEIAEPGAQTILAARSMDKLEAHAKALPNSRPLRLDLADSESIRAAVEPLGRRDILVNVAGTNIRKGFAQYTRAEYEHIMRTNLHGIVELTQQIGARMIERGAGGKIIMIGSLMSLLGLPYLSIYAMTKGALGQLTKALAAEWGRHNIQVNCIAPGFIVTDLNRAMWEPRGMREWLAGAQANPRLGAPDDVAPLAVFLAGRGADYITGQIIAVDGGYTTTAVWPFEPEAGCVACAVPRALWRHSCCAQQAPSVSSPVPWIAMCAPQTPGKCPRCGMTLVANLPEPVEYPVDCGWFRRRSPAKRTRARDSASPIRRTGAPVKHFEIVHEKLFHLFIVSQDLQYFAHVHPSLGPTAFSA